MLKGYIFGTNGLLIYNIFRNKNCNNKLLRVKLQGSIENLDFSARLRRERIHYPVAHFISSPSWANLPAELVPQIICVFPFHLFPSGSSLPIVHFANSSLRLWNSLPINLRSFAPDTPLHHSHQLYPFPPL